MMRRIDVNPGLAQQHASSESAELEELEELEYIEPTKEELIADLKEALQEALAGEGRDAFEFLDELDHELMSNANNR